MYMLHRPSSSFRSELLPSVRWRSLNKKLQHWQWIETVVATNPLSIVLCNKSNDLFLVKTKTPPQEADFKKKKKTRSQTFLQLLIAC